MSSGKSRMSAKLVRSYVAYASRAGLFWSDRFVGPVATQLKQGITPEKVALTIALGVVIGIFPILGATTLLCGLVAVRLRLNQPIIQLVNYLTYPVQIIMLLPFYRTGETLLGRQHMPLSIPMLIERFRENTGRFFGDFGMIGLGGIGVWCILAPLVGTVLYFMLRPPVRAFAARARRAELRPAAQMRPAAKDFQ